ncbi:hypothetical protein GOBAR_DD24342 [Gossypium barbadense]|nr:hypothetical protein GOBAR_DD24342 [Gossypium barbadense]
MLHGLPLMANFLLLSICWSGSCLQSLLGVSVGASLSEFLCWNCRGLGNPATVRELKQLLVPNKPNIISVSETKMSANDFRSVQNKCRMQNGLAVSSEGPSWRSCVDVEGRSGRCHSKLF